jgi:RNA polymerase sigma factor (sigma-70 family)
MDDSKLKRLSVEAMVGITRKFVLMKERDAANTVFLKLAERTAGAITNKLRLWRSIPSHQMEDVRQSIILALYEYIFSLDSGEELWECNFKTCFDFRILNVLGKLTRTSVPTVSSSQTLDSELTDELFEVADPHAETEFQSIEVDEALRHLDRIDSRLGKSFYLKYFAELGDKQIAEYMEVSERTVRNWIGASKKELRKFYAEQ